ncbi:MAG: acylphosphatase [Bacteroidetes bacterium]|nr:MAG: acylphosphatase [Bacteroidota bacterium]
MPLHYNITIVGRVQGVFFRVSTQKEAIRLGLTGFVRNESSGNVYVEVEGEKETIDKLTLWIRLGGPPRGEVNDVEIEDGEMKNFTHFEIR